VVDETLKNIRARNPEAIAALRSKYHPMLQKAFQGSAQVWKDPTLTFETCAEQCLVWAATKAHQIDTLQSNLEKLTSHPELHLCMAIQMAGAQYTVPLPAIAFAALSVRRVLDDAYERSIGQFKGFILPRDGFDRFVLFRAAQRALTSGCRLEETIQKRMTFPDLYLVGSVLSSDPGIARKAQKVFTDHYYQHVLKPYAQKHWHTVMTSEDMIHDLFFCVLYEHYPSVKTGHVRINEKKRPPLLTEYRGEGALGGWLTLTFGNMVRDNLRTAVDEASLDEERESEDDGSHVHRYEPISQAEQPNELDKPICMRMLKEGVSLGWKKLKPREQLVLILQTLHHIPPSIIARKILQVHEGTITKYTTNSVETLYGAIQEFAQSQLKLVTADIQDCFRFARDAFPDAEDLAGGMVIQATRK
jgi:hypothetical protein